MKLLSLQKRDSKGGQGFNNRTTSKQQAANRSVEDMMVRSTKSILRNKNKDVKTKKVSHLPSRKGYEPKFDKRRISFNATPTILTGRSFGKKLLMNNKRANKFLENGAQKRSDEQQCNSSAQRH